MSTPSLISTATNTDYTSGYVTTYNTEICHYKDSLQDPKYKLTISRIFIDKIYKPRMPCVNIQTINVMNMTLCLI